MADAWRHRGGITFNPPLESFSVLGLSPGSSISRVNYTARFASWYELETFRVSGAQLEVWTDLPVYGQADRQWRPYGFIHQSLSRSEYPDRDVAASESAELSTGSGDQGATRQMPTTLNASLLADLSHGVRFSSTYRIVHQSGHIQWSGDYERDGVITMNQIDSLVRPSSGWAFTVEPSQELVRLYESVIADQSSGSSVAHLNSELKWHVWCLRSHSSPRLLRPGTDAGPTSQLLVVPHADSDLVVTPQPFLIYSDDPAMSLSLSSQGLLSYMATEKSRSPATIRLSAPSGVPLLHGGEDVLDHDNFIYLLSPQTHFLASVTLPLQPEHDARRVVSILPGVHHTTDLDTFPIQLRTSDGTVILPCASEDQVDTASGPLTSQIINQPQGAQFIASPVHRLLQGGHLWNITVATSHHKATPVPVACPPPIIPSKTSSRINLQSLAKVSNAGGAASQLLMHSVMHLQPYLRNTLVQLVMLIPTLLYSILATLIVVMEGSPHAKNATTHGTCAKEHTGEAAETESEDEEADVQIHVMNVLMFEIPCGSTKLLLWGPDVDTTDIKIRLQFNAKLLDTEFLSQGHSFLAQFEADRAGVLEVLSV